MDYLTYQYSPPSYIIKYSIYVFIIFFSIAGLILVIDYVNDMPVNIDKNMAVSIAMKEPSLQQYIGKDGIQIQTISCNYYDPATKAIFEGRSNYMHVVIQVWYIPPDGGRTTSGHLFDVYNYYIKVDLKNNSIISSEYSKVV